MEIIAFILSFICITLNARGHLLTWLFSILSSAAYAWVFYEARLFGDAWLQGVFIVLAVYAWHSWLSKDASQKPLKIFTRMPQNWNLWGGLAWLALFLVIYFVLTNYTSSDVALVDAFLTAGSLIATYMSAQKWLENWLVWAFVNVIYIGLYIYKDLHLTALLYALLIALCVLGWKEWSKRIASQEVAV
jgi:nicotinamide mononucleotide transporter